MRLLFESMRANIQWFLQKKSSQLSSSIERLISHDPIHVKHDRFARWTRSNCSVQSSNEAARCADQEAQQTFSPSDFTACAVKLWKFHGKMQQFFFFEKKDLTPTYYYLNSMYKELSSWLSWGILTFNLVQKRQGVTPCFWSVLSCPLTNTIHYYRSSRYGGRSWFAADSELSCLEG